MRRRLRPLMARRTGMRVGDTPALTPQARRIGGWVVAAALVLGIAIVVGVLGDPDSGSQAPSSSSSPTAPAVPAITFGTALDAVSGEVATDSHTGTFADGDTFVYSVAPSGAVPSAVYVEVERIGGEPLGVLQEPVEAQALPNPAVIAFRVPAADLLAVFGAGEYVMRIYADPSAGPIAEGRFVLVGPGVSPGVSPAPSA